MARRSDCFRTLTSNETPTFSKGKTKENAAFDDYSRASLVPDFNIEILPQLTKEELEKLAQKQERTGSLRD